MDLSTDIGNIHEQIRIESGGTRDETASMQDPSEILDLSVIDLDNEETWLYVPQEDAKTQEDWPSEKPEDTTLTFLEPYDPSAPKLKSIKTIDTRTFTRPKKKYNRPSINDIEQMYLSGSEGNEMNSSNEETMSPRNKVPQTVQEEQETAATEPTKPLHFDLSQPTSLHNFDSFVLNNTGIDSSFQNMSPPSLINSLCSSTFANLMESSFIKNDPVLREIRDKDFTETALLQDMEAPMFQSITESCSSLNSDSPESFLKKVTRDNTFRRNVSDNNVTITPERTLDGSRGSGGANATFEVLNSSASSLCNSRNATFSMEKTSTPPHTQEESSESTRSPNSQASFGNLNGTYRRTPKHNGTFRKSDLKNNRLSLNLTYETARDTANVLNREMSKSIENDINKSNKASLDDLNSTRTKSSGKTVILHSDSIEDLKKGFSSSEGSVDLNRLSYCEEEKEDQVNTTYKEDKTGNDLNRTVEIKRSSLGSADSLDRMSSLSSSSKGSNKVLSMEDVQAIVEMQERSLSQVMSTPQGPVSNKNLWEHNFISPIVANAKDNLSDSELSDEYKSVRSRVSSKISLEGWKKPSAKNPGYLNKEVKLKTNQRTSYTMASQKPLQSFPNSMRGSYSNISTLKNTTMTLGGSQQNLHRPPSRQAAQPSAPSNLKTMGTKLKGSYTSLRPISATLPVVPPVGSTLNGPQTIVRPSTAQRTSMVNVTKIVSTAKTEVPQQQTKTVPSAQHAGDSTFVKPQSRVSGLPRPTGIPRPASRIPAPRGSNIRFTSSRNLNY